MDDGAGAGVMLIIVFLLFVLTPVVDRVYPEQWANAEKVCANFGGVASVERSRYLSNEGVYQVHCKNNYTVNVNGE